MVYSGGDRRVSPLYSLCKGTENQCTLYARKMRQKDEELQRTVGCRTLDKNLVNSSRWRLPRARAESTEIGFLKTPARILYSSAIPTAVQLKWKQNTV